MVNQKGTDHSKSKIESKPEEPIIDSYSSWMEKHPSALGNFKEMMSKAKGKNIVVFLDYDGTLSNIVADPDLAVITNSMHRALCKTADNFPTAIVSGRKREKVYNFVRLKHCYYAGSHGMDISTPWGSKKHTNDKNQIKTINEEGKDVFLFHPANEYMDDIKKIQDALEVIVEDIEGSAYEDNKFCVSVHYRRVPNEKDVEILKKRVENLMKSFPDFHISPGKMVMEIRPNIDWDKGRALEYLLETFGFDISNQNVFSMYTGDDKTDEDAFASIRKVGRGFPIVVTSTPKDTLAQHSLKNPSEVKAFLNKLVNWKKTWSPTPTNNLTAYNHPRQ